jgi:HEAT repeat protein
MRVLLTLTSLLLATSMALGQSLEHARQLAKSKDVKDRLAAVAELRQIPQPAVFEELVELFKDSEMSVRHAAAEALPIVVSGYDEPILQQIWATKDDAKIEALEKLRKPVEKAARFLVMHEDLVPALDAVIDPAMSPTRELIAKMAAAIYVRDDPVADDEEMMWRCGVGYNSPADRTFFYAIERRPDVAIAMLDDPAVKIKSRLIEGLGRIRSREALPRILRYAQSQNNTLRIAAVGALAYYPAEDSYQTVASMANDKTNLVRYAVAPSLAQIDAKRAVPILLQMLGDKSESVYSSASNALAEVKDDRIAPRVLELLPGAEQNLLSSLCERVMVDHPSSQYVPALIELVQGTKDYQRAIAIEVLTSMPGTNIKPLMMRLAHDKRADVRSEVARALAHWNDPEVWQTLIELLKDKDSGVVIHACDSLGELQVTCALGAIRAIKSDDEFVKRIARNVIEKITGTTDPP